MNEKLKLYKVYYKFYSATSIEHTYETWDVEAESEEEAMEIVKNKSNGFVGDFYPYKAEIVEGETE